jgi:threonine aldolase
MGSVLIGNSDLMKNAIRVRKVLGGGMRQVGFMAAAGIYALDNHVERLADDNKRAKEIGNTLAVLPYILKVETVETNIAIFYLKDAANEESFMKQLQKENIRISNMGHGKLRIVTHLDYSEEQHQKFLQVLKGIQF